MNGPRTGKIDTIAFGGEAVLRTENGVVFVRDALPTETVTYSIEQQKKRYARGSLVSIETPHPLRVAPQCEYFSRCGGCDLQHASYSMQLTFKQQWLRECLERIGGIGDLEIPPLIPAKSIWSYRRHITLHLAIENGRYRAIFHGRDPKQNFSPAECPIFSKRSLLILHAAIAKLPVYAEGRVQLMKVEEEKWIYTFHFKKMDQKGWNIIRSLLQEDPCCRGVKLKTQNGSFSEGDVVGTLTLKELRFDYSPEAFVQTHPDQSRAIYEKIIGTVQSLPGVKHVLDLYGGIGITAGLIAKEGIFVTSVELNRTASSLARENLKNNGLKGGTFVCGDVVPFLQKGPLSSFDLVIANPPREGISLVVLKELSRSQKPLLLISCMPSTLARDLKFLKDEGGYKLEWVQGYDMFPQTTHFETIAFMTPDR